MTNCVHFQYIRTMEEDVSCTEDGPFFPPTPRYIVQNGFGVKQDLLKSPDWIVIAAMLIALILSMSILIIALVSYGITVTQSFAIIKFTTIRHNLKFHLLVIIT